MTIILGGYMLPGEPILLNRFLPEIRRIQQILMFLISVVLIICFIGFMMTIYSLSIKDRTNISESIFILTWILFFSFGLFTTERYDDNGLFMFAWLGSINLIFTCVVIVHETVQFIILTTEFPPKMIGRHVTIVPLYTGLIGVMLQAVIVILAFKLSYLIFRNKKSIDHQQI